MMMLSGFRTIPCVVGVLFLASAGVASAQRPETTLDTSVYRLPPLRVTTSRLAVGGVPLVRAPFGAQVLSGAEVRTGAPLTVADALDHLPGVSLNDQLGSPFQPDVTLRGFSVSPTIGLAQGVSVFVDGVRVNEPDAGQVNWDLIPLEDVERVEVVRGPSGPFGKNALAGAINVVTRRGDRGAGPAAGAEISAGSWEQLRGRAWTGGALGSWDYYLSGNSLRSDGWRDGASARLGHTFAKLGRRGPRTDTWISYTYADDRILQAGSLPESWLGNPDSVPLRYRNGRDPRTVNFTGGDAFRPRLHFLVGQLTRRLGGGWEADVNAFWRQSDIGQYNANFTDPDSRNVTRNRSLGATAQLAYARGPLEISGGVEASSNRVGIRIFQEPNARFPDLPPEGELAEDVSTREQNAAAYAQARVAATARLSFTGTLRYDWVSLPFRDVREPQNDGDNRFRQLTGALGADWIALPGAVLFASWGRAFRAPTLLELACADPQAPCPLPYELGADPPLAPVRADTWQAGVRWFRDPRLTGEVVAYRTGVRDDIFNVQPIGTVNGYFQNLARTRREGIELSLASRPTESLELSANVAWTRATFQTVATLSSPYGEEDADAGEEERPPPTVRAGDHFPMEPAWQANAGARYTAGAWRLGMDLDRTGSQWLRGDENNASPELKLPAYTLLSAHAERTVGRLAIFAQGDNLLDRPFNSFGVLSLNRLNDDAAPRIEPFLTPGLPRRFSVGVRVDSR